MTPYQVIRSEDEWWVSSYDETGEEHLTCFIGPKAYARAEEYAEYMNSYNDMIDE